ncbi:MAG: DUF4369 domain-containing protein [Bacteroidales bacterium]|nr:DUF4369 domain-containing protein [Bacteroidales bacterium]
MKRHISKLFICIALSLLAAMPLQARKKPTYQITLKINGGRDTLMYMGHYYAKGNTVVDTARLDSKGRFVFSSTTDTLPEGLYFFANQQGTYVEFVVYHEKPFFTFETSQNDWTSNMQVKGSAQNEFFYRFHRIDTEVDNDLATHRRKLDSAAFATYRMKQLRRLDSIKVNFIKSDSSMFLSKMMLATKDEEPPLIDEHGDSMTLDQRRLYYIDHYFDHIPLDDNAFIRTPKMVFYDRIMTFFDSYLKYAEPKVIISYLDPVLDRAKAAPDIFSYLVMTMMQKYLQSPVAVYDEVYVHIAKKYYASDDNFWSSPSNIDKEMQRVNKWDRLLVGREAPELILYDTLRVPHSLHSMPNQWKLLIFWSPGCSHCQHIIPKVYEIFERYREQYDIGAFTILSEPDDKTRQEWRQFMAKHGINSPAWLSLDGGEANVDWHAVYDIQTTPQIYLIDHNNIIQAKKLGENSLEGIIKAICGNDNQ